jgi:hypothetical protein
MSNNANQTKVEAVKQTALGEKKDQYEFTIPLPEGDISKILSASASVAITNFEVLVGEVTFSGEACLNIVYSFEDGTVSNSKTCETFNGKFENILFDPSVFVRVFPNVIDLTIEKAGNDSIKVRLTLENTFTGTKNQTIDIFTNNDKNVFVKENEVELTRHKARNCQRFNQKTIFETKLPVRQILNTTSFATIKKADSLDGMVVFEGEVVTRILYVTNEDRPLLVSLINREDFREEVEHSTATKEAMVEAFVTVINKEIEDKINPEEKTIEVDVPLKICYDLYEFSRVRVTADAFSTTNEVNLATEAFPSNEIAGYEVVENKIDGSISLDEHALRVDKILAVDGAYLTQTNRAYSDGELLLEGLVHLNLIYLNDEEENINSVSIEVPYSLKEKIGDDKTILAVKSQSELVEIDAVAKRGRDIYVDGKIKTSIWTSKETQNAIVSSLELGEAVPERDCAIEIYFAKEGNVFWDVAKDLKISEELLKEQNPNLVEPFDKDVKVIYYEQRVLPEL